VKKGWGMPIASPPPSAPASIGGTGTPSTAATAWTSWDSRGVTLPSAATQATQAARIPRLSFGTASARVFSAASRLRSEQSDRGSSEAVRPSSAMPLSNARRTSASSCWPA
jgi:hypothetical protein